MVTYSIFSSDETLNVSIYILILLKHIMTAVIWRKSGMSTHLQLAQVVQTLDTDYSDYSHFR